MWAHLLISLLLADGPGGQAADAFLGTQGDVWDTQWDMFFALIGALVGQLFLTRAHDRSLARLLKEPPAAA